MDMDFLLIQKMKNGDDSAIDTFVRKYYPKILQYCHLHIDDFGFAEDLAQETFERFFRSLNQYQHYGKAVNYLYVIAANICKDYYKSRKYILMEEEDMQDLTANDMEQVDEKIDVEMALNTLSGEIREAAVLYYFQQLKQKEIARILGIGLPLVKYRIKKAKEQLNDYFRKEV